MHFTVATALAFAASATAAVGSDPTPGFCSISAPTSEEKLVAGKPYNVTWTTSLHNNSMVYLQVLGGASNTTLQPREDKIDNKMIFINASQYVWTPSQSLVGFAYYGLRCVLAHNESVIQYSMRFHLTNAAGSETDGPEVSTPAINSTESQPSEDTSSEDTTSEGTTSEGTPSEGTPSESTPSEGTPSEGTTSEGTTSESNLPKAQTPGSQVKNPVAITVPEAALSPGSESLNTTSTPSNEENRPSNGNRLSNTTVVSPSGGIPTPIRPIVTPTPGSGGVRAAGSVAAVGGFLAALLAL